MTATKKRICAMAAVAALMGGPLTAFAENDYSGTWVLNRDQSDLGNQAGGRGGGRGGRGGGRGGRGGMNLAGGAAKLVITQNGDTIQVVQEGGQGRNRTLEFTPGAEAKKVETPRGPAQVKTSWEGSVLVVHQTQDVETPRGNMTIEQDQRWELSSDGKTLTQKVTIKTPRRNIERKLVYERQ